jgi:hypothetical protein
MLFHKGTFAYSGMCPIFMNAMGIEKELINLLCSTDEVNVLLVDTITISLNIYGFTHHFITKEWGDGDEFGDGDGDGEGLCEMVISGFGDGCGLGVFNNSDEDYSFRGDGVGDGNYHGNMEGNGYG